MAVAIEEDAILEEMQAEIKHINEQLRIHDGYFEKINQKMVQTLGKLQRLIRPQTREDSTANNQKSTTDQKATSTQYLQIRKLKQQQIKN